MVNIKMTVRKVAARRTTRAVWGIGLLFLLALALAAVSRPPDPAAQILRSPSAPRITSFKIDNGAPSTTSRTVTLNNTVEGQVSDYRASNRLQDLDSAQWKPYSNAPSFELNTSYLSPDWQGDATKVYHCQVYFQVRLRPIRKELGESKPLISLQVADGIDFILPPREYSIPVGDAFNVSRAEGFIHFGKANDINSDCDMQAHTGSTLILQTFGKPIPIVGGKFGAKAEFVLFSGKTLHPRWKFKKISLIDSNCSGVGAQKNGYRKLTWPAVDSRNITIQLHTWCEANHICELVFDTLTLLGPGDEFWESAFKPFR